MSSYRGLVGLVRPWHPEYRRVLIALVLVIIVIGATVYLENLVLTAMTRALAKPTTAPLAWPAVIGTGLEAALYLLIAFGVIGVLRTLLTYWQERKRGELELRSTEDLEIRPNTWTAVVGSAESGKSTLLRLVVGLELPQQGTVSFGDVDSRDISEARRAQLVTLMPQFPAILDLSLWDNIAFGQRGAEPGPNELAIIEALGLGALCRLRALDARPSALPDDARERLPHLRGPVREQLAGLGIEVTEISRSARVSGLWLLETFVGGTVDRETCLAGPDLVRGE